MTEPSEEGAPTGFSGAETGQIPPETAPAAETTAVGETTELDGASRPKNADMPLAFSRREREATGVPLASSAYSGAAKDQPAWLKTDKDKYDKYGVRARGYVEEKDDKYAKYGASSVTATSRVKRSHEEVEDPREREDRDRNARRYKQDVSGSSRDGSVSRDVSRDSRESQDSHEGVPVPYSSAIVAERPPRYQTFQSHISNKNTRDINSIVRSHYNQRTHQSRIQGSRTRSPIYKLRNFNNAIKYILLGNFVKKERDSGRPSAILDLCCGKGGDLNKCEFVEIDQYIGIDISDASVKEAFSRYSQNKARFIPSESRRGDAKRYRFEACFATGDCFGAAIPDILEPNFPGIIDKIFPVDCVSAQFSLHYAFETEDKVRCFLNNVSKSLRAGGTFIGTIPSSDFIRDKIVRQDYLPTENGKRRFGNDLYSVTFEVEPPADGVFRPPYGNRYNYFLKDAIDDVPEYVVPFETLRSLCEDYGLVLKYKKNFIDIFNQEIPKYFGRLNKNLVEGMKRSDGKYGAEGLEKEAVGFYIGFVFEKLH